MFFRGVVDLRIKKSSSVPFIRSYEIFLHAFLCTFLCTCCEQSSLCVGVSLLMLHCFQGSDKFLNLNHVVAFCASRSFACTLRSKVMLYCQPLPWEHTMNAQQICCTSDLFESTQALDLKPDSTVILNNRAMAYLKQALPKSLINLSLLIFCCD